MRKWTDLLGVELSAVSWKEKGISLLGGILSILFLIFFTGRCMHLPHATGLVASMGASAVLLFAVPHGQLSQPWPVLAGHGFSALIGVACARWIPDQTLAAATAVGLSIGVMHLFKCIHPPGGATALTAVLGGSAVHALGFHFVLCPVLVNGLVMVAIAVLFNGFFNWRRYPAALAWKSVEQPDTATHDQVIAALRELDSFVDISEDDLIRLSRSLAELQLAARRPVRPAAGKRAA
ncbi:HPP family protein [Luteolibacter sp. SL250]|uniref:HPP family protein n=1 Tax=Luteolibacter sp. SL250 TaxID=2995170 RepID=UPI002270F236|nr:HPP family protein [Luteolibacter sp. SL250]WAC20434.1 HPP family protein [Luteolibacter sp. SL250]